MTTDNRYPPETKTAIGEVRVAVSAEVFDDMGVEEIEDALARQVREGGHDHIIEAIFEEVVDE